MFKLTILSVCLFASSVLSAEEEPTVVPIISEESVADLDGSFHYSFETGNGIKTHEEGELKEIGTEKVEVVKGGWEYTDPDGKSVSITYTADETGFHPEGDSLPVAPPVPEAIAKLVKYFEEHPTTPSLGEPLK